MLETMAQTDLYAAALLLVRLVLGTLLIMQRYDRLFRVGIRGVADAYRYPDTGSAPPWPMLYAGIFFTSCIEFFGGILLVLGLFREWLYPLLALDIVIATAGLAWKETMPDLRHIFPRTGLLLALMLLPLNWDGWALDVWMGSFGR